MYLRKVSKQRAAKSQQTVFYPIYQLNPLIQLSSHPREEGHSMPQTPHSTVDLIQ